MESITTDLCVYCLDKACETRKTELYEVGVCEKHMGLTDIEINETVGDSLTKNIDVNKHREQFVAFAKFAKSYQSSRKV
jgi:hypothetical protein